MHQRMLRGLSRAALVIAIVALALAAATSAKAWTADHPGTMTPGGTLGGGTCPQLSGPNFQQVGDTCFYFPDGSTNTPATCDPAFCGSVYFLFPTAGTFTASITYPSPSGFNLLGLQLCHNGQAIPDPANCPQTMSPGGTPVTCTTTVTTNDGGTPLDPSDDTATTTITCPIPVGDPVNSYVLIVYPLAVQHCDVTTIGCLPDPMQGITGALSASFAGSALTAGSSHHKVFGAGQLGPQQYFALHASDDASKWSRTHVRFAITGDGPTRCSFRANGASLVNIQPNQNGGGTATITGTGTVTDSLKIKHDVSYQLTVSDGGRGGTDTFQLNALGCDTHGLPTPVTRGHIKLDQERGDD